MLALLLVTPVAVAQKIEVIDLHNRPVEEIIPLVGPMIKPGEAVSGTGYKLILRASGETVAEVRRLLAQIDTGLQNLIITVRRENEIQSEQSEAALNAFYDSQQGGAISGQIDRQQASHSTQGGQRVRVLEGSAAYIHSGTEFYTPSIVHYQKGHADYGAARNSAGSGFYVVPRVNGNQVNLEISSYGDTIRGNDGTIDTQSVSTVISGQLGEWINIGGAGQTRQLKQQGILSSAQSGSSRQSGVVVKVDVAD